MYETIKKSFVLQTVFIQMIQSYPKMKSYLFADDLGTVIHAFTSSRVDYRNSLYSHISQKELQHLQLVQKEAS